MRAANIATMPAPPPTIHGIMNLLVAARVREIRAEYALAVAEEHVMPVPLVDTEIRVETVGETYASVVSRAFRCARCAT